MGWEFLVNLGSNHFKLLSFGHKCDETAFECLVCGITSLIVFVCFQDRLLWSACLLWSLAMSIVHFIWKLSVVLCDNHIAAYMVLARSDLQAFGILQTEHVVCNARCMTIWYLLFGKRTFILRGKQNENINGNLLDAFTKLFFQFLVGVLILW